MVREEIDEVTPIPQNGPAEEHVTGITAGIYRLKGLIGKKNFKLVISKEHLTFTPEASPGAKKKAGETPIKIEIRQVKSVKVNPGGTYKDCCNNLQEEDGSLEIIMTDKTKHYFSLSPHHGKRVKEALDRAGLI